MNAYRPHSAPTGDEREVLRREIVTQAREIGSRVPDANKEDLDALIDEAISVTRRSGSSLGWPLISVPLILEYEAVGKREAQRLEIPESAVEAIVRAFCFLGRETDIHFRLTFADNSRARGFV